MNEWMNEPSSHAAYTTMRDVNGGVDKEPLYHQILVPKAN
jgi:hypothetical protein